MLICAPYPRPRWAVAVQGSTTGSHPLTTARPWTNRSIEVIERAAAQSEYPSPRGSRACATEFGAMCTVKPFANGGSWAPSARNSTSTLRNPAEAIFTHSLGILCLKKTCAPCARWPSWTPRAEPVSLSGVAPAAQLFLQPQSICGPPPETLVSLRLATLGASCQRE